LAIRRLLWFYRAELIYKIERGLNQLVVLNAM
jgi:hypothetical protein